MGEGWFAQFAKARGGFAKIIPIKHGEKEAVVAAGPGCPANAIPLIRLGFTWRKYMPRTKLCRSHKPPIDLKLSIKEWTLAVAFICLFLGSIALAGCALSLICGWI